LRLYRRNVASVSRVLRNGAASLVSRDARSEHVTPITLHSFCHHAARRFGVTANEIGVAIIEIARGKK
jgi:hypothetical protein